MPENKQQRLLLKRRVLCAAGFSLPLALCLVLGFQLEARDYVSASPAAVAAFLLLAVGLTALTAWSFGLCFPSVLDSPGPANVASPGDAPLSARTDGAWQPRRFLRTWLVLAIPNLVVLLGVYPGFFVYDAQDELMEVVTRSFNTHHPLFHVLALGGTITGIHKFTGSWNLGIFVYLLLQMLLITAIYAYVLERLCLHGLRRPLRILFTLWYALFPTVVMYTLCSTKDGLFSAFATLFTLTLAEMTLCPDAAPTDSDASARYASRPGRRRTALLILFAVLMMLLRNNASYVMLVFAALLLLSCLWTRRRRQVVHAGSADVPSAAVSASVNSGKYKSNLIIIVIISFVIYSFANHLLILATHAENHEHQEMITVAIQSLGRAYAYHPKSFSEEDHAVLLSYLSEDGLRSYELRDADLLKATFNNTYYETDRASFWHLWTKIGKAHPGTYLTSWLLTSYGLWYPFTVQNVYAGHTVFTFTYTESSYFGYETELPGVRQSLIPPIDELYRWLSLDATIQKIPVLSLLFAPAFWFWFFAWFAARKLCQKRGSRLLPLIPFFLLWLTYLIGPYALVRYALPFFTALPVLALISGRASSD